MRSFSTIVFLSACFFISDSTLAEMIEEFPTEFAAEAGVRGDGILDVIIDPRVGSITIDTDGLEIYSIAIDSDSGIFDGPYSASFDMNCEVHSGLDIQIGCVLSPFIEPLSFNGIDELGEGITGDLPDDFDYLADLSVHFLDFNTGDLLKGTVIIVPEPSSMLLLVLGVITVLGFIFRRRKT